MIYKFWKWLCGYRKRYCIDCHKVTYQRDDFMVGWTCDECNRNDLTRDWIKNM